MKTAAPRTIVVGAGIVGASIAYHQARRGAPVTLIDSGRPDAMVTPKAFAWITVAHGLPEPYSQLRHLAVQEYRRLDQELGHALRIDWCGALTWHRDLAETERLVREHAAWGYDVRLVERDQIARWEPNLLEPPGCAAFAASEGAVDPVAATPALIEAARRAGAVIRLDAEALTLVSDGRRVTGLRLRETILDADVIVLAAGAGAPALCAPLGLELPVAASPALLLRFKATGREVNKILSGPDMEIRQASDRRLLAAEDYIDETPENAPVAIAGRAAAVIRRRLRGGANIELENVSVGMRPIPADGCPIVGFNKEVERLYIAVMHAGVTMAPLVGRLAATEILDDVSVKLLEGCRLERFGK
jgi:glycine/D-amino acid oxidase-like deaminating enzyme